MSDKDREDPPPVGSIITFRYQELSEAGIPRFPTFVGVRIDAEWPPKNKEPSAASATAKKKKPSKPAEKPKKKEVKKSKAEESEEEAEEAPRTKVTATSDILNGVTICITGTLSLVRREMVDLIESLGGSFHNSVTK